MVRPRDASHLQSTCSRRLEWPASVSLTSSPASSPLSLLSLYGSHVHLLQDEYFKVEQGVLGVVKNGVEYAVTRDDGIFRIPAGTR